jgi:hypothetical protein
MKIIKLWNRSSFERKIKIIVSFDYFEFFCVVVDTLLCLKSTGFVSKFKIGFNFL